MRRALLTVACAVACLCLVGQASAGTAFGVADNHPVGMKDDGAAFYTLMNDLGMTENRITVLWDRARPTTISREA